jgi:hypothetical protein
MLVDPPGASRAAGQDLPRRRPRYVSRIRIRRIDRGGAVPAATQPLSCWHVWLTDGLVAPAEPASETFGAIFARAEAIAAERAAAYRAHAAPDEAPPIGPRLDVRA